MSVLKFGLKLRLLPGPEKALGKPHDERLKRVAPPLMVKPGPAVDTKDVVVEGRDGPIPARVYARAGTRPGAPAILFIHGGGFVDGGVDFCDNVQRGLAHRTGYVVVGLSYRLAPSTRSRPPSTTARTCCGGCTTSARSVWIRSASRSAGRVPAAT